MIKAIKITREEFHHNVDMYLNMVKPGVQIEIGEQGVLIHPKDLRFLDKCAELVDDLPVGIESLIDEDME